MGSSGITLAMIVRDEAAFLPRCLASAAAVVDAMVVVDTGSRDDSPAIARRFGATVLHHPWHQDFAEARNVALEAVRTPWVLVLDADEELVRDDLPRLRAAVETPYADAYNLRVVSLADRSENISEALVSRLFRADPRIRYTGAIHEQIIPSVTAAGLRLDVLNVRILHYGYLTQVVRARDKVQRNLSLLKALVRRQPGDAYARWQLAQTYLQAGEYDTALREVQQAMRLIGPTEPLQPLFILTRAKAYWMLKNHRRAHQVLREGLTFFPAYTDFVYTDGLIAMDEHDYARAEAAFLKAVQMGEPKGFLQTETGIGTFKALFRLAQIALLQGDSRKATATLLKCVQVQPYFRDAWQLLLRLLADNPPEVVGRSVALVLPPDRILEAFAIWPELTPAEARLVDWAREQLPGDTAGVTR
ncbi:Glycosyl transferase family 2 [Candidatus Hydrogenisulfobacillus filiaventi]|uniref:Glycosyl transferase family 2 n=1 Tax=Candidatus Hydrogenisulfobacillus filiaventi TaxID=2707344 RepID=A0A6F8ZE55_9FIRM|nr:glycosyltransferase [Bacillota bacterium]CAB1128035.1 Glycosyl transferase family 2 [Candidatus Hydrogenisulfobacillus filiaventi]